MKKRTGALLVLASLLAYGAFAQQVKGDVTVGVYPAERKLDSKYKEAKSGFGGAYYLGDFIMSNDYITAAGKIYYRMSGATNRHEESQKLDIKRAYIRFRPDGTRALEISAGKLYSYYLPGNFFALSEIYTGSSRWGKTGVGLKSEVAGFTFGLGLPVTESYVAYEESFGINGAIGYNFKHLYDNVPLSLGADVFYTRTDSEKEGLDYSHSWAASANWTPSFGGFVDKMNLTLTYSSRSEPFVASSTFKNVTNYKDEKMKDSNLVSLNLATNLGPVELTLESEAGHSVSGDMVSLYDGIQLLIPFNDLVAFKPRFFYYGAIDAKDSDRSRTTYEVYPRLWFTWDQWTVSAGFDWFYKETEKDKFRGEWNVPIYVKYKIANKGRK